MVAVISKPPRVLRSNEQTARVLWGAHLLTKIKALDPHIARSEGGKTFSLMDAADRLASMCVSAAKQPTAAEAYRAHKHAVLNLTAVLDYQGCRCCGVFAKVIESDDGFPWRRLLALIEAYHYPGELSQAALATLNLPWQDRETLRLCGCIYTPLPWPPTLKPIEGHFAHVSLQDNSLVAYTENYKKGERDIQTMIKPGRYLTQCYPDLDPDRVRELGAMVSAAKFNGVHFAVSGDEIAKVYLNGPSSCMKPRNGNYPQNCRMNPVHAYGDSDLQVAYLKDVDGNIIARSVVWPEKKVHSRIYGDSTKLAVKLRELGYSSGGTWCFEGARLRRIDAKKGDKSQLLLPHFDDQSAPENSADYGKLFDIVDDDWIKLTRKGRYGGHRGINDLPIPVKCGCGCGGEGLANAMQRMENVPWLSGCIAHAYDLGRIARCEGTHQYYKIENMAMGARFDTIRRHNVSIDFAKSRGLFLCKGSNVWYATDYFRKVIMANGDVWEYYHFQRHGRAIGGKNYPLQEALALEQTPAK